MNTVSGNYEKLCDLHIIVWKVEDLAQMIIVFKYLFLFEETFSMCNYPSMVIS